MTRLYQMMQQMQAPANMQVLFNQFQQFRNSFRGDARQQIQQMMKSGQVTQAQYDNAVQTAQQFYRMLGNR